MAASLRKMCGDPSELQAVRGLAVVRLILESWLIRREGARRERAAHTALTFLTFVALASAFPQASIAASTDSAAVIARIGDTSINRAEFDQTLEIAARRKFFHGKVPDGAMAELQREVARSMVDNVLLVREARRRGFTPDVESVKRTISEYEARYKASEQWQTRRAALLPKLQKQLETDSLIQQIHKKIHDVAEPDAAQLQSYYAANLDKFAEPERARVSTILLKVDASALRPIWDKSRTEAADLVKKLRTGADFAQQARQRSGDESAANGGDMGYLHRGMLAEPAQLVVDKLKIKEISEPVTLLQGVAIFRLDERKPSMQNPLAKVEPRARELWRREQGERAWQALALTLRKATANSIDESSFLPMLSAVVLAKEPPKAK